MSTFQGYSLTAVEGFKTNGAVWGVIDVGFGSRQHDAICHDVVSMSVVICGQFTYASHCLNIDFK